LLNSDRKESEPMKPNKLLFRTGLVILFLFLPATLLYHGNPLDHMPGRDNGVFLYGGQQLLAGQTPYIDFWDHKGPLIYFIDALGLLIGKGSRWGVWGVELIFLFLTAAGIYRTSRVYWDKSSGIIAVIYWTYVLGQVGHYIYFHDTNYTEAYSLLFNVISVYFWSLASSSRHYKWCYLAMGASASFSLLLRPNNVGIQASLILVDFIIAISRRGFNKFVKKAAFFALGASIILVACAVWFLSRGALSTMVDAVLNYNLYYTQKNQVKGFATSYNELAVESLSKLGWFPLVSYGILALLWGYKQSKDKSFLINYKSAFILALLIDLPLETILSSISGRVFFHYMIIWSPCLAFLIGALASEMFDQLEKISPWIKSGMNQDKADLKLKSNLSAGFLAVTLICVFAVNFSVIQGYVQIGNDLLFKRNGPREAKTAIITYVEDATQPGDKVLVWGNDVWINFMTDRPSPTRYSYQFPLFMPGYTNKEIVTGFLDELKATPPVLIVEPRTDTAEMLPLNPDEQAMARAQVGIPEGMRDVFDYVNQNYCVVKEFHDTVVYRLKKDAVCKQKN
jgi:hypothetical protein